uniref:Uncharacterized protein n=1 Tax=Glossina palpalis gambiensis TaxID=67801 RepID=A0A1B0B6Q2_9MUSC
MKTFTSVDQLTQLGLKSNLNCIQWMRTASRSCCCNTAKVPAYLTLALILSGGHGKLRSFCICTQTISAGLPTKPPIVAAIPVNMTFSDVLIYIYFLLCSGGSLTSFCIRTLTMSAGVPTMPPAVPDKAANITLPANVSNFNGNLHGGQFALLGLKRYFNQI